MKLYSRELTVRRPVNRFGRMGYVLVRQYVATDDIAPFNKSKRIKFYEDLEHEADGFIPDQVTEVDVKVLSRTW